MSNISELVNRLVACGVAAGEAGEVVALAYAAGAASKRPKAKTLVADDPDDRALRGKKPLVAMPEPFPMTDAHLAFAVERGIGAAAARFLFDRFKAHHQSKGSKFAVWDAAWRTWVMNDRRYSGNAPRGPTLEGVDGRL